MVFAFLASFLSAWGESTQPSQEGFTPPKVLHSVAPEYPQELKDEGVEGKVVLLCVLDRAGQVSEVKVVNTSHDHFKESALVAIEEWVFSPAYVGDIPVAANLTLPFRFALENPAEAPVVASVQ